MMTIYSCNGHGLARMHANQLNHVDPGSLVSFAGVSLAGYFADVGADSSIPDETLFDGLRDDDP